MRSESEEGEIARASGCEMHSDDTEGQDHLQIKPPQRPYSEKDHHRSKQRSHERNRSRGDKRTSSENREERHHSSSKRHRYREREAGSSSSSYAEYDRRRQEKKSSKESSRHQHRRDRRADRDAEKRKDSSERDKTIRDAREKISKARSEQRPPGYDSGDEDLRRRRERLLAALHEKQKEKAKERSPRDRELPASYKRDGAEGTADKERRSSEKSESTEDDESAESTGSSEASETADESGVETDDSPGSAHERKRGSDDEKHIKKESHSRHIRIDEDEDDDDDDDDDETAPIASSSSLSKTEKAKPESDHGIVSKSKHSKRDVREEDEFLANKQSKDKDEDSQDEQSSKNGNNNIDGDVDMTELVDYLPGIQGCRRVEEFHCLNRIEEGTYGVVYRAKDKQTNEIVALKRLKMEKEREGFPITSLREINTLLKAQHPNIVTVREIVVGSNMDKIYIVMDYVEHDLKSLMETMKSPFLIGEVKTLMIQLLRAVTHMHDNWILHRDLKTSNLLLSHKGVLKVGDFGLAREYGSPLKHYTPIVVTLWYRAPELLLGSKEYSCPIDVWSVGCIFGELLTMSPMFPGKSEVDQLNKIFSALGRPSEKIWPGYNELPMVKRVTFDNQPYNLMRKKITETMLSNSGFNLLNSLLTYCPQKRTTAEDALRHEWFEEKPCPVDPEMFPTWPAKSEGGTRKAHSPKPPSGGHQYSKTLDDEYGFHLNKGVSYKGSGFSLKF